MKKYFRIENREPEGGYVPALSVTVRYDKGDPAGYRPVQRGYYASFSPVGVNRSGWTKGYPMEGVRVFLLPVTRQSPKKESEAEGIAIQKLPQLVEYFKNNGIVVGNEITIEELLK